MAASTPTIATTIISSINVNPGEGLTALPPGTTAAVWHMAWHSCGKLLPL